MGHGRTRYRASRAVLPMRRDHCVARPNKKRASIQMLYVSPHVRMSLALEQRPLNGWPSRLVKSQQKSYRDRSQALPKKNRDISRGRSDSNFYLPQNSDATKDTLARFLLPRKARVRYRRAPNAAITQAYLSTCSGCTRGMNGRGP